MRNFWKMGEAIFFLGTTLAVWSIICGQVAFQYIGMGLMVLSEPLLLAGAVSDA